ncbi:MAG TPA: enoyl-CoA hydratase-related protein [bacterium]|nr:enoyl-CoA hydratase-related protein [bacterium]
MTQAQYIKTKTEDGIAVVTLDHPPVNLLTSQVIKELDDAFVSLDKDPQVKVIVFTTAGTQAFIAGADIKEIAGIRSAEQGMELAQKGQKVLDKIENMKKICIAAIHGICVGGGNELIMAFHLRIASERAKFGQPEILLGIIPGFGGTQRLTRLAGLAKARELILTGDMITAQEAFRIGLVNRVVPDGELIKQALGLAKKIASKSQVAVQMAEQAMRAGVFAGSLQEGLEEERKCFGQLAQTADMKEGVQAFLEKRQPKFQDR